MPAQSKLDQVAKVVSHIEESDGMFVVNYTGLTVSQAQELRAALRNVDAEMKVFKNNLVKIALEQKEQPALDEILAGPVAYVFFKGEPVESARILRDFAKKNKKVLEIKGGISDGEAVDAAAVLAIADLPTRDQLLSMVLQASLGPVQGLINVLDKIQEQKEGEEQAA